MNDQDQLKRLKAFVNDITSDNGIIDSRTAIEDAMLRHGLFEKRIRYEPCGGDCICEHEIQWCDDNAKFSGGISCGIKKADWLNEDGDKS